MLSILETIFALFSAYGIVFFLWWIVALVLARRISYNFLLSSDKEQAYINWLKFAGISPAESVKEEPNETGIDDN